MMEPLIQVSFRYVPFIEVIAADVRARAEHLRTYDNRMLSCHVAIEQTHYHHHDGNRYRVRVELAVPGELLVIVHTPHRPLAPWIDGDANVRNADEAAAERDYLQTAVHDAFDEARRRLQDDARRRRGMVKRHEVLSELLAS